MKHIHQLIIIVSLLLASTPLIKASDLLHGPSDAYTPTSRKQEATVLPLHTVTIATRSLEATKEFYVDGWGLKIRGPLRLSSEVKATQIKMWNMPPKTDYDLYILSMPSIAGKMGSVRIRLLHMKQDQDYIHQSFDPFELGPSVIGFPNMKQKRLDWKIRSLGFGALNAMDRYQLDRVRRGRFWVTETIFNGPDFIHAQGIQRGAPMRQLGPINLKNGTGGPAFAGMVVDDLDQFIDFFIKTMGMEARLDQHWQTTGSFDARGLPSGTEGRTATILAKGYGPGGHLLLTAYDDDMGVQVDVKPALPNLGMGMWSFPVKKMDVVLTRAKAEGVKILSKPQQWRSPILGRVTSATIQAPNGFPIELFKRN